MFFLYVWEHWEKLIKEDRFYAYLFQAAGTRCIDHLKRTLPEEKYKTYLRETFPEVFSFEGEEMIMEELSLRDFYKRLYHVLELLPAPRREVFLLTYIEGMKAQEVAERIHIPRRTVESHLYLAIKYLRNYFSGFRMLFLFFFL